MTTRHMEKFRCAVCGAEAEFTIIRSTNAFGSSDLDTRPPEMQRSTMDTWVQRCPGCGYCADNVSKAPPQAANLVHSSEYKQQVSDSNYPELANSFLCKALLEEAAGDYTKAAWALIHAVWACDDTGKADAAKKCRVKAVKMIGKVLENGQRIARQDGADLAIRADLLRRAGLLDEARQLLSANRPVNVDEVIYKMLDFQEILITNGDLKRHTVAEAFGEDK